MEASLRHTGVCIREVGTVRWESFSTGSRCSVVTFLPTDLVEANGLLNLQYSPKVLLDITKMLGLIHRLVVANDH